MLLWAMDHVQRTRDGRQPLEGIPPVAPSTDIDTERDPQSRVLRDLHSVRLEDNGFKGFFVGESRHCVCSFALF